MLAIHVGNLPTVRSINFPNQVLEKTTMSPDVEFGLQTGNKPRAARVLLGVCGGIAAYKSVQLVRLLMAADIEVQVVMTRAASEFLHGRSFEAITGSVVRDSLWDRNAESAMGHIELARWADLILIAPCTAHTIARLAHGFADDLLSTLCLATPAALVLAPAMNQRMWLHPAVQDNVELLAQRGVQLLGPAEGDQACGDVGPGRMTEPEDLVRSVLDILQTQQRSKSMQGVFEGKNVLITAGPTYEDIDPVRFIANRSSGKMGYALAQAAQQMGANVQLVSGPVKLATPNGVERLSVRSAQEMYEAVLAALPEADIFIAAAAVADFRPALANSEKIKKQYQYTNGTDAAAAKPSAAAMTLELVANPDILAEVCARKTDTFCVGFAAETENLRDNAYVKRLRKGADLIAANWVGPDKGFDVEDNAFLVLGENFEVELPRSSKSVLAQQLMVIIAERLDLPLKLPNTSE